MTELKAEHFEYLDTLHESGANNMFDAAPWLANAYDLPRHEAREILRAWIDTFDSEMTAEARLSKARGE